MKVVYTPKKIPMGRTSIANNNYICQAYFDILDKRRQQILKLNEEINRRNQSNYNLNL